MKIDDACPRTPDSFRSMVEDTLSSLPASECVQSSAPARRHIPRKRLLLAAALAALMISSMALATHLGLLDMVFNGEVPSKAAQQTVTDIGVSRAEGGYRLEACQYLLDGGKLHLYYDIGAGSDALALIDITSTQPGFIGTGDHGRDKLIMLNGAEQSMNMYSCLVYDDMPAEPFKVTIEAYIFDPLMPIAELDPEDYVINGQDGNGHPRSKDLLYSEPLSGGRRVIFLDRQSAFAALPAPITAADTAARIEQLGMAKVRARLSIDFTIDPSRSAGALRSLDEPQEFAFDDYTLRVNRADFYSASSMICFTLHPNRPMPMMDMVNNDPLWRHYEARMADGTPFTCIAGGGFSTVEDADGNVYLDYELRLTGVNEAPDAIMLTPYITNPDGTHKYFEDETVTVRLTDGK